MSRIRIITLLLCIVSIITALSSCSEKPLSSEDDFFFDGESNSEFIQLSSKQKNHVIRSNEFSTQLLSFFGQDESVTLCPVSVQMTLSMLNDGVDGIASEEIKKSLGFWGESDDLMDTYYHNIVSQLPLLSENKRSLIANAVFFDSSLALREEFSERISRYYEAPAIGVDFGDWQNTKRIINDWVETATAGQVEDYTTNEIGDALVVLLNATRLSADWVFPFNLELTQYSGFTYKDNYTIRLPFMRIMTGFRYLSTNDYKAVSLPLGDNGKPKFSFIVALPEEGKSVSSIINGLNINSLMSQMNVTNVDVMIPKFQISTTLDMIAYLRQFGIKTLFSSDADYSPMFGSCNNDVIVSHVLQKTLFSINETGVEADSATAVAISYTSPSDLTTEAFYANRPFLWFLIENGTGIIVFEGIFAGE